MFEIIDYSRDDVDSCNGLILTQILLFYIN